MKAEFFGILIITSFIFGFPLIQDSYGLSCAKPDLKQDVENSEIVFSGRVISSEGEPRNENGHDIYTTFSIIENFKGIYWDSVLVRSHNIWGPGFAEGKEYLVFAEWKGNNVIASLCSSTNSLEDSDIELVRTVSQGYLLPPLQQIEKGVNPEKVKCKKDLNFIFKATDNSPACVKPESIPKLIERGWAKGE